MAENGSMNFLPSRKIVLQDFSFCLRKQSYFYLQVSDSKVGETYEPKPYPVFSMSIRQPLVGEFPCYSMSALKTSGETGTQVPQTKSVEKHLEMSISMKNTVHVFIALFISILQWNAPTSAINQLNSHGKKKKK